MGRKKIALLVGTRPEAIKMIPIVKALKKFPQWFETLFIFTGQHKEHVDQIMDHFGLVPNIQLNLMSHGQTLGRFSSRAIEQLDRVFDEEKPDFLMVHGDTQTSVCGSLCAYFHKIPTGHVEAGLRSYNKYSPWPEENNRKINDVLADIMFAPTESNKNNLLREGYNASQIHVTGQTAIDLALSTRENDYRFRCDLLNQLDFQHKKIITCTMHRRENIGPPMERIFQAIRNVALSNEDIKIIYPVHLNPAVQQLAVEMLSNQNRIHLLKPLHYPDMINLLAKSTLVISDSGGIQEEATTFQIPLILARDTTERPEAIQANIVTVAGTETSKITELVAYQLQITKNSLGDIKNPFGDGKASERIAMITANYFGYTKDQLEEFKS